MFANNVKYLPSPATLSLVVDCLKQTDLAVTTDDFVDFNPSGKMSGWCLKIVLSLKLVLCLKSEE
jgi:hypothetical protein